MQYKVDHDYHLHSYLSDCSNHPEQTPENLLKYAQSNGFDKLCLTDHYWNEDVPGASDWYKLHSYSRLSQALPLPQGKGVEFYFGCETEMDKHFHLGINDKDLERFAFIIVPTTHLHMEGFTIDEKDLSMERKSAVYVERFARLLENDLPFEKMGIAHLTSTLLARQDPDAHIRVVDGVDSETYRQLFAQAAKKGVGIELNIYFDRYTPEQLQRVMRPYQIAKSQGCKFYFGSDAHTPQSLLGRRENFENIAAYLKLEESDKFRPFG